jgi:hypothetical protein
MKREPNLDPDFAAPAQKRSRLARTCLPLLLVVLVVVLAWLSLRTAAGPQALAPRAVAIPAAHRQVFLQPIPGAQNKMLIRQPGNHFVVIASSAIDPRMVLPAPEGIDAAMVVPARDRQAAPPAVPAP